MPWNVGTAKSRLMSHDYEHDPEKWMPVFGKIMLKKE
jgi:hypothetical protein